MAETVSESNDTGTDIMIYEPTDDLNITESEMDAEIDRLCTELDSNILDPASDEDSNDMKKVLNFVKEGLVIDNSHMEAFDNDYDDEIDPDEIMDNVAGLVSDALKRYVPLGLFNRVLKVQNDALKRLNDIDDRVRRTEQSIDSFRSSMVDTNSVCSEGIRRELETVNLKYNSVNERLDGMRIQLGNVVAENLDRDRRTIALPLILAVIALILGLIGIIT